MKPTMLTLSIILLCAASSVPVDADDTRDVGVKQIAFMPQGDGTVAINAKVTIRQIGAYGFRLVVAQYRDGQLLTTLRDSQLSTSASGCAGIDACPGGANCVGSCLIGNIFLGYHGTCENSGCCFPGGPGDCRYFCYCLGDVDFIVLATLAAGDSIMATIIPSPGTVDSNLTNNSQLVTYLP